jgi:hypothetical protein
MGDRANQDIRVFDKLSEMREDRVPCVFLGFTEKPGHGF